MSPGGKHLLNVKSFCTNAIYILLYHILFDLFICSGQKNILKDKKHRLDVVIHY